MNPKDYDLLLIESPFEYNPSTIFCTRHEKRREQSVKALVNLVQSFSAEGIPIRAISDVLREPGMGDEYICGLLQQQLEMLTFPEPDHNYIVREKEISKLLKENPRILLTGGFVQINEQQQNCQYQFGACVGDRAGWLYTKLKKQRHHPFIHIDTRSTVIDLIDKRNIDPRPNALYLVKSVIELNEISPVTKEPFREVIVQAI